MSSCNLNTRKNTENNIGKIMTYIMLLLILSYPILIVYDKLEKLKNGIKKITTRFSKVE
jgi:hypothetical protein